jgi:hypothetical protein
MNHETGAPIQVIPLTWPAEKHRLSHYPLLWLKPLLVNRVTGEEPPMSMWPRKKGLCGFSLLWCWRII